MPSSTTPQEPAGEVTKDVAARNITLVVCLLVGGLGCFLLFLVWNSFRVAAPTVLWSNVSPHRDPLLHEYPQGYQAGTALLVPGLGQQIPSAGQATTNGQAAENSSKEPAASADQEQEEPEYQRRLWPPALVDRGQRLFRRAGCSLCHGREGKGGVTNTNYINDTFPSLNTMAKKLSLEFPEDADVVIGLLSSGISLEDLSKPDQIAFPPELDIPDAAKVAAKYGSIAKVILEGTQAAKKDVNGPEPIVMPSYKGVLSEVEMNELIASFLIMYPVEEEAWDEKETR